MLRNKVLFFFFCCGLLLAISAEVSKAAADCPAEGLYFCICIFLMFSSLSNAFLILPRILHRAVELGVLILKLV